MHPCYALPKIDENIEEKGYLSENLEAPYGLVCSSNERVAARNRLVLLRYTGSNSGKDNA